MSGVTAKTLSQTQISTILDWVKARLQIRLNSPTRLSPGQPLLASLIPATPELDVSELVNGIINFAWLEKDVLFKDLGAVSVPGTDTANGTGDLDGDALLNSLEGNPANVVKQPFPPPSLGSPASALTSGLASQLAGTLALPRLSVSIKVQWVLKDSNGTVLSDGTDMISSGLTSPTVSIMIPPLFRELRADTLANPGGSVVCLSAIVTLAIGTEAPISVTLGPIPILQLPLLSPTVVALFSEPNFGLTEDASVVLLVPKHSPFSSAAPLFKELQKIEGILDSLRSIASIATFLLGLSEIIALTEQPRLRFVSADGVPKLGDIKIKHKPWYNFFGTDPNFDDAANSLFVFGVPGTKVTFFNDTFYKHKPQSNQGYYTVELFDLNHLTQNPDPNSPLPDFFTAIRSYPTKAEVQLDPSLSDHTSPPPTSPPGRILDWAKDGGDSLWYTDLSSVRFHQDWLDVVNSEVTNPSIIGILTCNDRPRGTKGHAQGASQHR